MSQIEEIAERAAEAAVAKLMLTLGVNARDPHEVLKMQKDFAHLRSWRESTDAVKRRGMMAAVTFLVTAVLGCLVYGFSKH
jgi:hypothetical protein